MSKKMTEEKAKVDESKLDQLSEVLSSDIGAIVQSLHSPVLRDKASMVVQTAALDLQMLAAKALMSPLEDLEKS